MQQLRSVVEKPCGSTRRRCFDEIQDQSFIPVGSFQRAHIGFRAILQFVPRWRRPRQEQRIWFINQSMQSQARSITLVLPM
jgi:hypothetical protein